MEPLPIGRIVEYHGKRFVITGHETPRPGTPDPDVNYPDGVAYTIWREGIWQKFGNRHMSMVQVRRQSLTDTGEYGDVRNPYVEGETDEDEEPPRVRAARELAAEFGTDVEEWLI